MSWELWLFVIGCVVLMFIGNLTKGPGIETTARYRAKAGEIQELRGMSFMVVMMLIAVLMLVVTFSDWRRGLVNLGLSEGWSWVVAPLGSVFVLAAAFFVAPAFFQSPTQASELIWKITIILLWLMTIGTYGYIAYGVEYIAHMFG